MTTAALLQDDPLPGVRRLTLNRPEKRNALSNELRSAILTALRAADADPAVKVFAAGVIAPTVSAGLAGSSGSTTTDSPGVPGEEGVTIRYQPNQLNISSRWHGSLPR